MRYPFSSRTRSLSARIRATRTPRMDLECLEGRELLAGVSISIADVSVREGPASVGVLDPSGAASVGLTGNGNLTFRSNGDLFVTSIAGHSVARFDWTSQTYQPFVTPNSGGLGEPYGISIGPDGNVYVSSPLQKTVFRYDGSSGSPLPAVGRSGAVFVADDPSTTTEDESGGLNEARGITFGADGNLYVCSRDTDQILRYQGPTGPSPGTFMGVFASVTNGKGPQNLTFGPDDNLYVGCLNAGFSVYSQINRYDGATGAPIGDGVFVALASGGLNQSRQIVIDPQGMNLYVAEPQSVPGIGQVLRYQGPSAANPGAYVEAYITSGQGGRNNPNGLARDADGNLYTGDRFTGNVTRFAPRAQARFDVTLSAASASHVSVAYATASGTAVAGDDYVQTAGTLIFAPGETTKTVAVSTLDDLIGEPTEIFQLSLSNAENATIVDGQGIGTILDNETKFYVVDNTSGSPRTYEYGSGGTSEEISPERDANTQPRGVASTTAGDKVWVVDANKKVYVYDTAGTLLGSWTAGSLVWNATIEGIATNGTDVWIVDAKQDKVFRYINAASRLSGSQNAASSFNLNNGNRSPKDVVTDGVNLWVINDSTTDKVFKYTLTGSMLGSWTITGAGSSPTGITLDPTGGGTLWTVDSGTDRVYQFDNARGLTSGSLSPSTSFALAAGNTNPQGIADPPMPALGTPRIAVSSGASHPSGHLASHQSRAFPRLPAAKSTLSSRPSTAVSHSILDRQMTPILIPLMSSTDQDFTPLDTERIHARTKRIRIAIRV